MEDLSWMNIFDEVRFFLFWRSEMEGNKSAYFTNKIVKVTMKRIKITPLLVWSYQKEKYDKLNQQSTSQSCLLIQKTDTLNFLTSLT